MANMLKEMSWSEAKGFIEGRLNRLAMCKRGSIATDIANMKEKLGKCPRYTEEERATITAGLENTIISKCKITKTMIRKANGNANSISHMMRAKIEEVTNNAYVHPGIKAWEDAMKKLDDQKAAREAQLDGDFRDALDEFILGSREINTFPALYDELEAREW